LPVIVVDPVLVTVEAPSTAKASALPITDALAGRLIARLVVVRPRARMPSALVTECVFIAVVPPTADWAQEARTGRDGNYLSFEKFI